MAISEERERAMWKAYCAQKRACGPKCKYRKKDRLGNWVEMLLTFDEFKELWKPWVDF
jgi:hypothetical protein